MRAFNDTPPRLVMFAASPGPPPDWLTRSIFCPSIWPSCIRNPDNSARRSAVVRSLSASTAYSSACFLSASRLVCSSYFSANASSGKAQICLLTSASSLTSADIWSIRSRYQIVPFRDADLIDSRTSEPPPGSRPLRDTKPREPLACEIVGEGQTAPS